MKKISIIALTALVAIMSSCQEEVVEITDPSAQDVITANSTTAGLVQRTASGDGSFDNIVDGNSCISIAFPYTLVLNDVEYVINSEDDLDELEKNMEESDVDDDEVEINFPITVIRADYSEIQINNEDELEELSDDCIEGGEDDDIECLDFAYPLTLSIYDATNQLADVITIDNDKEFYELIDNLDEEDFLSFSYPITLVLWDGQEVVVNDNEALEDLIEEVADDCDEDDDNDFDDDDVNDSDFVAILTDGKWEVSLLFDETDFTNSLQDYSLEFKAAGVLILSNGDMEMEGVWESDGNSGHIELSINFEDSEGDLPASIKAMKNSWEIISYSDTQIRSTDDLDDIAEDDTAFLTLEKIN